MNHVTNPLLLGTTFSSWSLSIYEVYNGEVDVDLKAQLLKLHRVKR